MSRKYITLKSGSDIESLLASDLKRWAVLSMPVTGVRFDKRTLELLDTDHDGRVRADEILDAIRFLKDRNVDLQSLFTKDPEVEGKLADVVAKTNDLDKLPPSAEDLALLAEWEKKGREPAVLVAGADTPAAVAALDAVEKTVGDYFLGADDLPLVSDEPERMLPLRERVNPKFADAIFAFGEKCVKPVLGDVAQISRRDFARVVAAFAPYRAWVASKPVMNAGKKAEFEVVERELRYRLHLLELLENFASMRRLYADGEQAIFQTGVLRIDSREMKLCFHVDSEAAHSDLSGRSKCCVIYLKLTRPADKAERLICAVVTAGGIASLYAGRNGLFLDRDGQQWEAVITKVVENQVSLVEAFWAPWRKIGQGIAKALGKFLGDRQNAAVTNVQKGTESAQVGGAAMASSVAAVGIGISMVGAATASIMAAIRGMDAVQLVLAVLAVILVVSLPSVIITWFKLRQRDIGAVLNAGGWAVNRTLGFSVKRARAFTIRIAPSPLFRILLIVLAIVVVALVGAYLYAWYTCGGCACK